MTTSINQAWVRVWLKILPSLLLTPLLMLGTLNPAWSGGNHAHGSANEHPAEDEPLMQVFTHHNEHTELFVEFAPLVAGQASTFITHFTRQNDFKAIEAGELTIHLQQGQKSLARFRVTNPVRSGIFLPSIQPRHAGRFRLVFELKTHEFTSIHDVGEIEVFAEANQVQVTEHPEGEITYLKEQQWQQDFALTQVKEQALRPSVTAFAQIQAPASASLVIRAPADGYFISAAPLLAGQAFEAQSSVGVVLPRLSEGTDLGHLQVALQQALTQTALAQAELTRMKTLFEQGAVPKKRLFEAEKHLELAKVEEKTAQNRLNQQSRQKNLTGIELTSPIKGQLIDIQVRSGEFVKAGEALFTLANADQRWLAVKVPEKFATRLHQPDGVWFNDQQQTYRLDSQNGTRLVSQGQMIDPKTRTLELLFEYSSNQAPNLIGASYPVHVYTQTAQQRLAIPNSAVIDDNGLAVVYVQESGESFSRRPVKLGMRDGDWVEVLAGVKGGERVVSQGAYFVKLASSSQDEIGHGHAH